MKKSRLEQAARNNAAWCDALCRSHAAPGEFLADAWINCHRAPAFYPNLVTLEPLLEPAPVLESVRYLTARLPGRWAVKDSFQSLNLSELGFDRLFDASWICHASPLLPTPGHVAPIRWAHIVSPDELKLWEASWAKANGTDETTVQFPPSLLADAALAIFAGYHGSQLIAGGIANASDEVVGLSNVFSPPSLTRIVWAGLLANIQAAFPIRPIVGYEHGPSLGIALDFGFEVLGPLTVWLKHA